MPVAVSAASRLTGQHPGSFTAQQIDLVLQHRQEVSFGDWDAFVGSDVPREVAGARRADELARNLLALPGWSSEQLAGQRVRLDPGNEAAQIRLAARELYDPRCELEATSTDGRSSRELVDVQTEWHAHLHTSLAALNDRLAAFDDYVQDVIEVADLAEKAEAAWYLAAALDQHGPRLAARTVSHEMAASDLQVLRTELHTLKLGLQDDHSPDS